MLECGRVGLCGGRLRGPSILRDIIELRTLLVVLSVAAVPPTTSAAVDPSSTPFELICTGMPPIDMVIEDDVGPPPPAPATFAPGVLEVDRCILGDDGTLAIV